jgi:hypothetical protein
MATGLQKISTFGDDEILKGLTANLLTFTNIVGPVFEEAQVQALNLSARLGQDLQSSAIQLGKALNDPIKGITALSRVGVAFTETQKAQIETMMKSGNIMAAQKVILAELAHEFNNQATAMANTAQGKLTQAWNAFGDAVEVAGGIIAPAAVGIANAIKYVSEAFQELSPGVQRFIVVGAAATTAFVAAAAGAAALAFALGAISVPITLTIGAVGLLAGAVAAFWPQIVRMAEAIDLSFQKIYESAKTWLVDRLIPVFDWIRQAVITSLGPLGVVIDTSTQAIGESITAATPAAVEAAKTMGESVKAALAEKIGGEAAPEAAALTQSQAVAAVQQRAAAEAAAEASMAAAKKAHSEAQAELNRQINEGVSIAKKLELPRETELRQINALNAAYKANKISAEALGRAQQAVAMSVYQAYAGVVGNTLSAMSQLFEKNKKIAIAAALVNTFEGVTKALSAYPPPLSYIAAAGALASGMAQVMNIRKTTAEGGGGGGTSMAASSDAATTAAAAGGGGERSQTLMVQGISPGQFYSGESVKDLAERLLAYQRDGGQVVLQ